MALSKKELYDIFINNKRDFNKLIFSLLRCDSLVTFDQIEREKALEDVMCKVIASTDKVQFHNKFSFLKYCKIAIINYCKRVYYIKETQVLYPKISANKLAEEYRLARDIINRARPVQN